MDFVLVHGAYHGAWCWEALARELAREGHRVIAPDLPISTPGLGATAYAGAVESAMADAGDPILVGHSMAGLVVPIVAANRRVRRMVLLAAFMATPGVSANDQRKAEPIDAPAELSTAQWTDLGQDVWSIGPETATELFYHDVSPEAAAWACARLRPQCYHVFAEPSPLATWPDVATDVILCRSDRAVNPGWVRSAARDRLGVEPIEIDGGHSPFLSRPAELAAILDRIAAEKPDG